MAISSTVDNVRRMAATEHTRLYCWSSGGAEYARAVCESLGIADLFTGFLPKPDFLLDDQAPVDWRGLVVLHPNEFDGDLDAVRERLGWV